MGAKPAEQRFRERTSVGAVPKLRPDLGPCLIFQGADNGNGYKQFRFNGRNGYAHRYAWERAHGSIVDGLTVDHLCMVRACCNVDHLELVPGVENYLRGVAARTSCKSGHPYREHGIRKSDGRRVCDVCERTYSARSQAKRRRIANGLPDRRVKYDQGAFAALTSQVIAGELGVTEAASKLGCSPKYFDKRVRAVRGVIRPHG
ncbi:putative HNH endonuclease [uncultured Caudovirales phage]|uniref:Putative HNH endonuclease n=1 Tax=uncultured Caudovirales phage TaxID=2100421 RepID=A0A2H4J2B1_9CAUD|nr:putative HNH endonuclease [uncultured Caudovirales phage]